MLVLNHPRLGGDVRKGNDHREKAALREPIASNNGGSILLAKADVTGQMSVQVKVYVRKHLWET